MQSESFGNATTEHHGLGGVNKGQFERLQSPKPRWQQSRCLVSAVSWLQAGQPLSRCPHREAGARELPAGYLRRAQGPPGRARLLTETPPRAPASGHHHVGIRISYANFGETQPIEHEKWENIRKLIQEAKLSADKNCKMRKLRRENF